jgi:two-component system response regulator
MSESRPIFLVEDSPDDELLTTRALRKSGFANPVLVARDGAEALAALLPAGGRPAVPQPALVLLDLKLPKVDGLEVLARLRADPRTRRLPVVALTSSTQEDDVMASYDLGVNGYVRKPISFPAFVEAARAVGLFWLMTNESPVVA